MISKPSFLTLITALFLALPSFAARGSSGSDWIGMAGLSTGAGTSENKSESIQKRDLLWTDVSLDFGYNMGIFSPMIHASYRYVGQKTDPSTVGDSNMAGSGYLAGAGILMDTSVLSLLAVYNLAGTFTLAKTDSGGSEVSYTSPTGLQLNVYYHWRAPWDIVLSYCSVNYAKQTTGSTSTDIADDKINQTTYGLGISYRF